MLGALECGGGARKCDMQIRERGLGGWDMQTASAALGRLTLVTSAAAATTLSGRSLISWDLRSSVGLAGVYWFEKHKGTLEVAVPLLGSSLRNLAHTYQANVATPTTPCHRGLARCVGLVSDPKAGPGRSA